jgi:CRISPR-associated endoribonuclease Cas6
MPIHFVDVAIDADPAVPSHAIFRTLSPVTMSVHDAEHRKHYLTPDDDWSAPITENLRNKVRALTGQVNHGTVTLTFDKEFIRKRESSGRHVTKLCTYKDIKIRAVAAPFTVTGDPELITMGYDAGFGDANPEGFGMVDHVKEVWKERNDNRRVDR